MILNKSQLAYLTASLVGLLTVSATNVCRAEHWPSIEELVPRCVLIVHCRTEEVEGRVLYKVLDVWKGEYSPLAFVKQPPTGYITTSRGGEGAGKPDQEVVLFYTRHNQPKEGISRHDMVVPVIEGRVTYPPIAEGRLVETQQFSLADFKREVKTRVEDKPAEIPAAPSKPDRERAKFAGAWRVLLPAGFEHQVTLKPSGEGRYRLEPASLNCSGVYEVQGDRLVLVEPREPRFKDFCWKIQSVYMATLVEQPNNGSSYVGAVLFRGNDRQPAGK